MPDPVKTVGGIALEELKESRGVDDDLAAKIAAEVEAEESANDKKELDQDKEIDQEVSDDNGEEKKEVQGKDGEDKDAEGKDKEAEKIAAEKEAEEKKKADEELNQQVEAYSKEHGVTVDVARQDIESIGKIVEKYKGDPKQLAKANLHIQRLYTETQEKLKAASAAVPAQKDISIDSVVSDINEGKFTVNGKQVQPSELVELYRANNADLTENVDDDTVMKMAAKEIRDHIISRRKEEVSSLSLKAKEKRESILNSLPENEKQFLTEIKPIVDSMSDAHILDEHFSIKDTILWAKGKRYDADIKERGEREYKRGLEQAKILDSKPAGNLNSGTTGSKKRTLTSSQKAEALNMFDGQEITEEKKFELYSEILEEEDKKGKK